ncbi:MAG: GyrI-like domain-containing protein [bacterium]
MPVSETAQLPDNFKQTPNMKIEIKEWEYGDVAEILHIGPYSEETPTIEKLHNFIKENGYKVIGEHEEEYLKGPGMFGKGNPKKYYTIIRLRVAK